MRQRLIKAIFCVALSVFVFFCTPVAGLADEIEEGNVCGEIVIEGSSQEYDLSTMAELGENDYTGSTSIHTQTSYGLMTFTNTVGNEVQSYQGLMSFDVPVPVLFRMAVERGHTYSGQIWFVLHMDFPANTTDGSYRYKTIMLKDVHQQSFYDGVTVSYYGFQNMGMNSVSGECSVVVTVTFDNFQPTFTGDLNVNSNFTLSGVTQRTDYTQETFSSVPMFKVTCSVSSDWAGELYDYDTDAIVDSDGSLIKNQTIQQQQIADQQAQQSAQQHDNLVNGYDNSQDKANQEAFDSVLSTHESQEHALLEEAMSNVSDVEMDLSWVDRLTATFSFIRTVFMAIVTALGDFGILITVTLCFALALFALGWFRS